MANIDEWRKLSRSSLILFCFKKMPLAVVMMRLWLNFTTISRDHQKEDKWRVCKLILSSFSKIICGERWRGSFWKIIFDNFSMLMTLHRFTAAKIILFWQETNKKKETCFMYHWIFVFFSIFCPCLLCCQSKISNTSRLTFMCMKKWKSNKWKLIWMK